MKEYFYSESLNEYFTSKDECLQAEEKHFKEEEERKAKKEMDAQQRKEDARLVEDTYQNLIAAKKEYRKALSDFCKKYGAYKANDHGSSDLLDLFQWIF